MKVLFVGGSSIGHVAPNVAVWRAVQKMDARAWAHFVCSTKEMDQEFLQKENVAFSAFPVPSLSLTFPFAFLSAYQKASQLMNEFGPDVIFSKGGALSVPVCAAARRKNIPIVLHESDAVSGRANAMVAKWATKVCLGFPPEAISDQRSVTDRSPLNADRSIVTGNPIRPSVTQGSREAGLKLTNLGGQKPILLVLGGSQGAQAINEIVSNVLPELLKIVDVIHITGKGKSTVTQPTNGYASFEFAHEELPHLYACASLALSRSGAGMISELSANSIPTILVPLRGVAHDHQEANARAAEKSGGCMVIEQEYLKASVIDAVRSMVSDETKRRTTGERFHLVQKLNAAEQISSILADVSQKRV